MNATAIMALIQIVVQELPGAVTTVQQLMDLAKKFFATANGRAPTDAEIKEIESAIDADVMTALAPLPPAQPGDPDYQA